jgi:hypothetical protein
LARLYNYDLGQFDKAESLYRRSWQIILKQFGPTSSNLKFVFEGLVRVYEETGNWNKHAEFSDRLREWEELLDKKEKEDSLASKSEDAALTAEAEPRSVIAIVADLRRLGAFSDREEDEQ